MLLTRRLILAAGLTLALALPASAQDADWTKVVEAAKKEGKVSLYTSVLGGPFHIAVTKAFEKKYGIAVELLDVRASELRERVRTEQATGRFLGDVTQNGQATLTRQEQEGVLQPHGGIPNIENLVPPHAATDVRVPSYVLGYGILINTNLVKPADEPKSWMDLLDPRYKGKIISDDMRALGGGQIFFTATYDAFGKEFHDKLATQEPVFSRDVGNDERRVARGEFPLRIPQLFSNSTLLKGLPVKLVIPVEGAPYIRFDLAVLKNAPHPNAARLLIEYYLSPEAQAIYADAGLIPVVKGIAEKANPDIRPLASAKLLGTSDPNTQDAMLDLAKQIYK
ncbi:MAG: Iron(III) transport system substrate-binding protein [Rhodospirillales bacterium]|jgi:iron(III) transport system substrate-binding protein|nr:Iron(III) transport system substrate-binding protein [Rhodospirillales bacterium]